jgi:hypothetical protein
MPNFMEVVEKTLLMTRQLANPVPRILLFVVIGWAALLFMSFGLLGAFNGFNLAIQVLGSSRARFTSFSSSVSPIRGCSAFRRSAWTI